LVTHARTNAYINKNQEAVLLNLKKKEKKKQKKKIEIEVNAKNSYNNGEED